MVQISNTAKGTEEKHPFAFVIILSDIILCMKANAILFSEMHHVRYIYTYNKCIALWAMAFVKQFATIF